jgi:hypothetical protein
MIRLALVAFLAGCGDKTDPDATRSAPNGTDPGALHDGDGDGYPAEQGDCDDGDAGVHPDADEHCNGIDDDCDADVDEDPVDAPTWYADEDLDGFGDAADAVVGCTAPSGYVATGGDCDDTTGAAHPGGATVACDGLDNDCDPATPEVGAVTLDSVPQPDLPTAIGAAAAGSEIELCEGEYVVPEMRLNLSITLRGLGVPEVTRIRGSGNGALFRVEGGVSLFESVALVGGTGHALGDGDTAGGALWVADSQTVALYDTLITGNLAGHGGGVWLGEGATLNASDSRIDGNSGDPSGALLSDGGGIYASRGAEVLLDGSHVDGNDAELCGGADLEEANTVTGLNRSTIDGNESTSLQGGGVCVEQGATLSGLEISRNSSSNTAGGIFANGALTLSDDTVAGNHSALDGGGITALGDATLTRVLLDANTADVDGAAISASNGAVALTDSTVTSNRSPFFAATGAALLFDATLVSTDTDWGGLGADNAPADVGLATGGASFSFRGVASFTCSDEGGDCQ